MLFNSIEFIVFLGVVYATYLVLPFRLQNYLLLAAGYFFYGWWDVRFLFLISLSTTLDYWLGLVLDRGKLTRREAVVPATFVLLASLFFVSLNFRSHAADCRYCAGTHFDFTYTWFTAPGAALLVALAAIAYPLLTRLDEAARRKACVLTSLIVQLSILSFFKYFNFFADSLHTALQSIGIPNQPILLNVILPVGVSFYTFQSLSYMIDVYRREFKPTNRFGDFALFVSYFPQLQAGPIERARNLLPAISNPRSLSADQTFRGLHLITLGFFKKVGIADGVAPVVANVFNNTATVSWIEIITGTVLFAVQIYCDFSGYSDIARGVSKMLGIDLMVNFKLPYFSGNPQEFWKRWHISLSTWLRDYLYIPLGGNKGSFATVCKNLMITMTLGGLWHGASWNFVLWGIYQGTLLCLYRIWRLFRGNAKPSQNGLLSYVAIPFFFLFVCYGWLLFRANSFDQIAAFTSRLFTDFGNLKYASGIPRTSALLGLPLLVITEVMQFSSGRTHYYLRYPYAIRGLILALMVVTILLGTSNEPAQFIYFQF
jgi:alginate O-acetyltransferase complex protein AlgI